MTGPGGEAARPRIVPYLDRPLPHIHDRVLKRMQRRVNRDETQTLLRKLRAAIPGLALRTTFIAGFPEQYQTLVGPGGHRLSGGQRQRIALARAILRRAEILILDEATSQIDVESEHLIHDSRASLGRDHTLLMITHRTSSLVLANRVLEVQNGQIAAREHPPKRSAA